MERLNLTRRVYKQVRIGTESCELHSNTVTEIRIYDLTITLCRLFILHLKEMGQTFCCKNPHRKETHSPGVKAQKMEIKSKAENN